MNHVLELRYKAKENRNTKYLKNVLNCSIRVTNVFAIPQYFVMQFPRTILLAATSSCMLLYRVVDRSVYQLLDWLVGPQKFPTLFSS